MRTRPLQLAIATLLLTALAGAVALKQRAAVTGAKFAPMPNYASKVTTRSVKSGNWSDGTVWSTGKAPAAGDSPQITAGQTVTYDVTANPPALGYVDVLGTLDFGSAPGNKQMVVNTIIGEMGSTIIAGSCPANAQLNGTLTITYLDQQPDPTFDPAKFSNGWLSMGKVDMCGSAKKTLRALVAPGIPQGATSFTITTGDTTDWNVGDTVLIPGLNFAPIQDEQKKITAVNGLTVTLDSPTAFNHTPPQPTANAQTNPARVQLAVANMTTRIVMKSQNPSGRRGHFMIMRDGTTHMASPVTICHVSFVDMGQTDKSRPVTDPMVDANGALIPGTADNPRARYACHSHRTGQQTSLEPTAPIHVWESCVATNTTVPGVGWGFNNHDSHVLQDDCISYNFFGSCEVTERGSELGHKRNGLQVRTVGSGETEDSRDDVQDFGHLGTGVWLAGPGVYVEGNYMYGHRDAFLVIFSGGGRIANPNKLDVLTVTYPSVYLTLPPLSATPNLNAGLTDANGNITKTSFVPIFGINNNVGCGSALDGFRYDWNETPIALGVPLSNPTGNVAVNSYNGHKLFHVINFQMTNAVAVGQNYAANSLGMPVIIGYTNKFKVTNPHFEGYETGMQWPQGGITREVNSGYWANKTDIDFSYFPPATLNGENIQNAVTGTPLFGATPFDALGQRLHYQANIFTNGSPFGITAFADLNEPFYPRYMFLPGGQQLYYSVQDPSYVLFPKTGLTYPASFPTQLIGLTNQQLSDTYGLKTMGALAQKGTNTDPLVGSGGIIGPAAVPGPFYVLQTAVFSGLSATLQWFDWNNQGAGVTTDPTGPTTLQPGRNVVTKIINGQKVTFFPYSTATAPPTQPTATTTTVAAASATSSATAQSLTLSATIAPAASEGTVTFSVLSGSTAIGSPVTSGTVANGMATVSFALPAGTAAGSYTIQAAYSGTANFAASTGTGTLTVSAPAPPPNPNAPTIADMQAQVAALQAVIARLQADIAALQNPVATPMLRPTKKR